MPGRNEADIDIADAEALSIGNRIAVLLAVADAHDRQSLRRRPHRAVPAARMVGMAVRDESPLLRPRRIDPGVRGADVNALRKRLNPGTEARHRELYRSKDGRVPGQWRMLHGRNFTWIDG